LFFVLSGPNEQGGARSLIPLFTPSLAEVYRPSAASSVQPFFQESLSRGLSLFALPIPEDLDSLDALKL